MMALSRRVWLTAAVATPVAVVAGRRLVLGGADQPPASVSITVEGERRLVTSNGLPEHITGDFPNPHDPVPLRAQQLHYAMPLRGKVAEKVTPLGMWHFGVAVNGVPFDPSGPFWNRDGNSGWQFEVLCPANAVALGIDVNRAHTQGRGMYHYHGLPTGLLWDVRRESPEQPMNLLGYASDGFPIYGPDATAAADDLKSPPRRLRSSYRLRSGHRPSGPKGRFDGTFVEDFEYVAGLGDLDECNGRTGPTPEFPAGTYYYVITDEFPFIPRLVRGTPDPSFRHGPPPGMSPPVPPQLMRYQPRA
jgi:hypothetical protein